MNSLVLRIARIRLRAELPGGSWAAEAEYHSLEDLSAAVAQLVQEIPGSPRARGVTLLLEPPLVQVRKLSDLPAVSSRDLRSLIAMQSGRFFRKNGKPLITDAVWLSRQNGVREALAAAVEAPIVEAVLIASRDVGLDLLGVAPAETGKLGKLSLMPTGARAKQDRAARVGLRRLGATALAAWLFVGTGYPLLLRWERERVEGRRHALAGAVQALSGLRREVYQARQVLNVVEDAEVRRGRVLALAANLASALPDSAFFTFLLVRSDGTGLISGRASRAAQMLASLVKRKAVEAAHLEGPTLREAAAGREWEGFTIRFGTTRP